jgi:hypothetical protein
LCHAPILYAHHKHYTIPCRGLVCSYYMSISIPSCGTNIQHARTLYKHCTCTNNFVPCFVTTPRAHLVHHIIICVPQVLHPAVSNFNALYHALIFFMCHLLCMVQCQNLVYISCVLLFSSQHPMFSVHHAQHYFSTSLSSHNTILNFNAHTCAPLFFSAPHYYLSRTIFSTLN